MRIIFLDIDGVLNNEKLHWQDYLAYNGLSLQLVQRFLIRLGALREKAHPDKIEIVLSSDWRNYDYAMDDLRNAGINFIGTTEPWQHNRGRLIKQWLNQHEMDPYKDPITHYVILDDNDDEISFYHKEHFVQTNPRTGLTHANFDKAEEILGF